MSFAHAVGASTPPIAMTIERGRLRLFAHSIGETNPVYTDVDAARAAGYPDLLVPPTYLFGVELEGAEPTGWLDALGVDLRALLHGEQEFTYVAPVFAGELVQARSTLVDAYEKKGGALQFLVRETEVTRAGDVVARLRTTLVVRQIATAGSAP
ncbi:hypothetical protein GCM10009547_12570 [Sporichthya brevicatena]|uniref:FAS1-like dehydratase domain-containing protein n=1 Tax=Sporichthya brevicatena TaxID=171442 RepID=A0ABP3RQM9_9ACTN